ncbi:uncharacterized protein LOC117832974 [Xyrichtys novacula]|uniref:Uncharacterized protein LOC117832974 n=1 Tax=Xyrichtys novacula TaxID=13765 RepID=A0AAV1GQ02_XYRNO|nr:uncharacterized protein LOC117832974 [Xyrichtys novacula]
MSEKINLYELLNSSIQPPRGTEVNFSSLHALLRAILEQLDNLRDTLIQTEEEEEDGVSEQVSGNEALSASEIKELPSSGLTDPAKPSHTSTAPGSPPNSGENLKEESDVRSATEDTSGPQQQSQPRRDQTPVGLPMSQNAETISRRSFSKLMERVNKIEALVVLLMEEKVDQSQLKDLRELINKKADASKDQSDQLNQRGALTDFLMSDWKEHVSEQTLKDEMSTHPATMPPSAPSGPQQQSCPKIGQIPTSGPVSTNASVSESCTEMAVSQRSFSKLMERFDKLEALVASLKEAKVDQSQMKHLQELINKKVDVSESLSDQLKKQEALIDHLMSDHEKDAELVNSLQRAILQLQAECEKLQETTRSLQEDNSRRLKDIQELFKTTEELQENKADKLLVESATKTDQLALDGKVSRVQFDSVTEELNTLFQELLNKVTGQEQKWHQVISRLSSEMACKLNRMEFDPVKKQLEDRWEKIHKKLQNQEAPECDDAAALKTFRCLSCDRRVTKNFLGPNLMELPISSGEPSNKGDWQFTLNPQKTFQQHNRSLYLSGLKDYTYPRVSRSCGGKETIITRPMYFSKLRKIRERTARAWKSLPPKVCVKSKLGDIK